MSEELHHKFGQVPENALDATSIVKEQIDLLWKYAQQQGYKTLAAFLRDNFAKWDDNQDAILVNTWYEDFLHFCQQSIPKEPYGMGTWGTNSTFGEFLTNSHKENLSRLEELRWLKEAKKPSFDRFTGVIEDMKDVPAGVGEAMSIEDYELYEELLKRSNELRSKLMMDHGKIDRYLRKYNALKEASESAMREKRRRIIIPG